MERRVDNGVLFHAGTGVCETFLQGCPFLKRSLVNGLRLRARKNGFVIIAQCSPPAPCSSCSAQCGIELDVISLRA